MIHAESRRNRADDEHLGGADVWLNNLPAEFRHLVAEIGPLLREEVRLPGTGVVFDIVRPAGMDHLLDRAESDPEQNLPYWAELWPSGIALAAEVSRTPRLLLGRRILEVGCGLGVTANAALAAGGQVLAIDYFADALSFCRRNARLNLDREPETRRLNWRVPGDDSLDLAGEGFPVVLAADVLYEQRDVEPLLALVDRYVAAGGLLWLAEPGRPPAARFLERALELGWQRTTTDVEGPWPDPKDEGVIVRIHRLSRR